MGREELAPGTVVAGCRVERLLGRGGMGAVYAATDERLGRKVALKVVAVAAATQRSAIDRLVREARAAAAVRHAGVVGVHDLREDAGRVVILQELVAGASLQDRLRDAGPLPWRVAARAGADVAHALAAVHAAGVVHRDLKPSNVLLDEHGRARLTDFGLAWFTTDEATPLTATGELVGTLEYLAPEMAGERSRVGPAADLYGLGATLHALVTGRPPFAGSGYTVVHRHLTEAPRPLAQLVPDVPAALSDLVLRLLAKEPAARGSAEDAARSLEDLLVAPRRSRSGRGGEAVRLVLVALVAGALGLGLGRATAPAPPTPPTEPPAARTETPRAAALVSPEARTEAPRPPLERGPDRYEVLAPDRRPALPLPTGLTFGAAAGEYVNTPDGSVLVFVSGGEVELGGETFPVAPDASAKPFLAPARRVTLSPFFIGKYEVSFAQYQRFVRAAPSRATGPVKAYGVQELTGNATIDASWLNPLGDGQTPDDDHPVTQLCWQDAANYCDWAGLTLPTEAQWERAATWDPAAGRKRPFAWGEGMPTPVMPGLGNLRDQAFADLVAARGKPRPSTFDWSDRFPLSAPVRSFPEGAAPCDARHLVGNVSEWCRDWFDPDLLRRPSLPTDPEGLEPIQLRSGPERAVRGASYAQFASWLPAPVRMHHPPERSRFDLGFRVARAAR